MSNQGRIAAACTGIAAAALLLSACASQSAPPAASAGPPPAPVAAAPPAPPPGMGTGQGSRFDGVYAGNLERAGVLGSSHTVCQGNMYHPMLRVRDGQASIHWYGDNLTGPVSPDGRLSVSGANNKIRGSFSGSTFSGQIETQYCRYDITATRR